MSTEGWILVAAVIGLLVGAGLSWLLLSPLRRSDASKIEQLSSEKTSLEADIRRVAEERGRFEVELAGSQERAKQSDVLAVRLSETEGQLNTAKTALAAMESQTAEREKAFASRLDDLDRAEARYKEVLDSLAQSHLRQANEDFAKYAEEVLKQQTQAAQGGLEKTQSGIEEMLKPMSERLKELEALNRELEEKRGRDQGRIAEQLQTMLKDTEALRGVTQGLTTALNNPGQKGQWGELILERVIEMAGLEKHVTHLTQATQSTDEGRKRPDLQIMLPGGRNILVDSKAVFKPYLASLDATDDAIRRTLIHDHARDVLQKARDLKARNYQADEAAPDFVVLFIPSEAAFRTAIEARPELFEEAMGLDVVLASPSTMLALLRVVALGWRQEQLAKEAQEIAMSGQSLYKALVTMKSHYDRLGKSLAAAGKAYNDFGGSLERNVLPKARRFQNSGSSKMEDLEIPSIVDFTPQPMLAADFTREPALPFEDN